MRALSLLDPDLAAPTSVDRTTSKRLPRAVRARDGDCYCNALSALPRLSDATYTEGVVVLQNGIELDHAWLECAAGVVDPTPSYAAMTDGECTYFAGPRWTLGDVFALFAPGQDVIVTPILHCDLTDSPRRQAWIGAKLAAFRHASALCLRRTGQTALATATAEMILEALLGSYWARWAQLHRTDAAHASDGGAAKLPAQH